MPPNRTPPLLFALGLATLIALILMAYSPGITRGFEFDDAHNLIGLESIHDQPSALSYIFTGTAGPLGRPLALASFSAQFYAWPVAPEVMLGTNVLIHALNTVLLCWVALRLAQNFLFPRFNHPHHPARFALLTAALWGLSPLLASASLFAVQRMTTLSATFMLLGVLCHLILLPRLATHPRRTALALLGSLALFTVLATLTKENGALLPLLVLCLHLTILPLRQPTLPKPYSYWPVAAFVLPMLAVLWVLGAALMPGVYDGRAFTLSERLLTEGRILIDYLRLTLLPVQSLLGPYHDDYPLSHGLLQPVQTLPCLATLAVLLALALHQRRRWPMFAFAVLWFLVGHVLESTTVPLELYFEHRNYVPVMGLALALAYAACTVPPAYRKTSAVIVALYLALLGGTLLQTTQTWGDRLLSAELWAAVHPDSPRTTQNLANSLSLRGRAGEGLEKLRAYSQRHPKQLGVALQVAHIDGKLHHSLAPLTDFVHNDTRLRSELPDLMICSILDEVTTKPSANALLSQPDGQALLYELTQTVLSNPKLANARVELRFCVNRVAASLAFTRGDLPATMAHLEAAFAARPTLGIALQLVGFPTTAGLFDAARENLAHVRSAIPRNPFLRQEWETQLNNIEAKLNKIENMVDKSEVKISDAQPE
jgi:hypothetical protein